MGAPYIARAPKKVLVRIPRNEGYTTVPSGMATLRLIPSPLDKPTDTDAPHTEPQEPSPLDRPQQFTTGPVPSAYTPNRYAESPQGDTTPTSPIVNQPSSASPAVSSGGGAPSTTVQQLCHGAGVTMNEAGDSSRSVVLQATPPRGQQQLQQQQATVYRGDAERSSSPGHHVGGHLAPAVAAATPNATSHISTPLHYQGHFTASNGRLQQATTTAGRQQQPPTFTDFIAGQVWRALMMASQQQQQQLLQQQQHASGFTRRTVGGKRIREVASTHQENGDEEPTRKLSRVSPPQPQHHHGLQEAPAAPSSQPSHIHYTAPPSLTVSHTTFHTIMPTPPTTPPTTQHNCNTDFHTTVPTPPTTPPSAQQYCNPSVYDTEHLPLTTAPRLLSHHPQQPLVPLSPPALHLPIMFPPVFPQSLTSIKGAPQQQFSLSRKSNNSSSGPVTVSGCGGGGGQGAAPPPHHHHQAGSQLTATSPVGLSSSSSSVANPLLHRHLLSLHHHHQLHAALIQPIQGGGRGQGGSGAHFRSATAMTVVGPPPGYLAAVPPTEHMTVHVAAAAGERIVNHQAGLAPSYGSTNVKTSSHRSSPITDSISHSMVGPGGAVASARGTPVTLTNNTTFTSHCT